ncbi:vWA domain-containing protein [Demequina sediminicola]|uniref:vWA domain-containing protein n=1 Tax=Demequina sediminicola TaxID=1095026 RepID=UPI0007816A1A|nr:vWA domain-containing protein [Demequina sediminicola]
MTDSTYTALLLIIDRSGSMMGIRDDMLGGLTRLVDAQAAEPGRLTIDVVQFDDEIEHTHHFCSPEDLALTLEPRGTTALWDAVGRGMADFGQALAALSEDHRPQNVQVVVITDGMENASVEYTGAALNKAITRQREDYSWNFTFLGANQDAIATARDMGISAEHALTYATTDGAVAAASDALSHHISAVRAGDVGGFSQGDRDAALNR